MLKGPDSDRYGFNLCGTLAPAAESRKVEVAPAAAILAFLSQPRLGLAVSGQGVLNLSGGELLSACWVLCWHR